MDLIKTILIVILLLVVFSLFNPNLTGRFGDGPNDTERCDNLRKEMREAYEECKGHWFDGWPIIGGIFKKNCDDAAAKELIWIGECSYS